MKLKLLLSTLITACSLGIYKQESITSNPNWNLNLLRSKAVNSKVKIANWKTDLFFPLVK